MSHQHGSAPRDEPGCWLVTQADGVERGVEWLADALERGRG